MLLLVNGWKIMYEENIKSITNCDNRISGVVWIGN